MKKKKKSAFELSSEEWVAFPQEETGLGWGESISVRKSTSRNRQKIRHTRDSLCTKFL